MSKTRIALLSLTVGLLALLGASGPALGDVSVTIGYETRPVGEIDPCG